MRTALLQIGRYSLLAVLALGAVGPFLWLVSTAIKPAEANLFAYPPELWPSAPTLENFQTVWSKVSFPLYIGNSLAVAVLTVELNLLLSVLAAYPLARLRFIGQQSLFYLVLSTMMVPFQVLMIPLYLMLLRLGLDESHGLFSSWLGLAIPFAVSGFGIVFVTQAMKGLPKQLDEAALLDGASHWQVLWHILVPLLKPTLATLAIFTFIASWGEFLWPSIMLSQNEYFTLPVGLVQLQGQFSSNWRWIAAGTLIAMGPVMLVFLSLQRFFMRGGLNAAVKG